MPTLTKYTNLAAARLRLERCAAITYRLCWSVALTLGMITIISLVFSLNTPALIFSGLALLAVPSTFLSAYLAPIPTKQLRIKMDLHAKLPDSVLTAGDWENDKKDPWKRLQFEQTERALQAVNWVNAWPVQWPKQVWLPSAAAGLFLFALGWQNVFVAHQQAQADLQAAMADPVLTPDKLKPVEAIFKDWEEAQKIAPDPDLAALLKDLAPLRQQMKEGKISEKEMMLQLSNVQARLQAAEEKMQASSLDSIAPELAESTQDLDGLSGLSAALERKDYEAAKNEANNAKDQLDQGKENVPQGDKAQADANKMGDLSQKASEHDIQAGNSLQEMKEGIQKNSASKMSEGLKNLSQALARQAQANGQSHNLRLQMSQLSQAKKEMNDSGEDSITMGMSQISLTKSLKQGKGAGNTTDPNYTGPKTNLAANLQKENLTGTLTEGNSQTETEHTDEPQFEKTASSIGAGALAKYKKLSEEAADDENLPAADRQVIKHYFENIRPNQP
jgi:hypothetical protein